MDIHDTKRLSNESDAALVARVQETGDPDAFQELHRRYHRQTAAMCYRHLKDRALTDDIVQESFMKAYKYIGSFCNRSKFSTWLYRIARNEVSMHFRKHKRLEVPLAAADRIAPPHRDVFLQKHLRDALGQISPRQRDALLLHVIEGIPTADIAAMANVPLSTYKSRAHHARMRLRTILGPIFQNQF